MKKVKYCILIEILLFEVICGWLLNFDIIPNSNTEKSSIPLESCKVNYWTQHNTECMDGCSMVGELRYGPNYLSGNAIQEFPYSIGINCKLQSYKSLFGKSPQKEDYWIKMDICTNFEQSMADLLITELKYDSRKFFENSVIINKMNNDQNTIDSAYIGAYHMNSIGNILRYKYTFFKYVKCSLIIDLLLICLLVINFLYYKFRLIQINRIRAEHEISMKQVDK